MIFDRKTYFDSVRAPLFGGSMNQRQVDGQEFILTAWETYCSDHDQRWLANFLAQSFHETSQQMWPIEEYGKGGNADYAQPDPVTGQRYYGRGLIQLTWAENYQRADSEFGWSGAASCYWNPELQLEPDVSARTGYRGCAQGWFRRDGAGAQTFGRYFNAATDDAFNSREIVNGDKNVVPDWSNNVSIGNLIKGYHEKFLAALKAAFRDDTVPPPEPTPQARVLITVAAPPEVKVEVKVINSSTDEV